MKYLLSILLLCLSGYVVAGQCPDGSQNPNCDYPGYLPSWDDRFNVTIMMENAETGELRATSMTGGVDYAQGGSLYGYLVMAVKDWYTDLGELAEQGGMDARLVPTPDSPMTQIISIERDLADR